MVVFEIPTGHRRFSDARLASIAAMRKNRRFLRATVAVWDAASSPASLISARLNPAFFTI